MKLKFVSVTAVTVGSDVVLYAVDSLGELWWCETKQAEPQWRPLPLHPGSRNERRKSR